jgi:hypothetical protein
VKYALGVEKIFNDKFGWSDYTDYDKKQLEIKHEIETLVNSIKDSQIVTLTPFDPKELYKHIGEIKFGGLMRTMKYWSSHLQMETIWNYNERVHWKVGRITYLLVAMDDIRNFYDFYDNIQLEAALNGLSATAMEFYLNVVIPAKENKAGGLKSAGQEGLKREPKIDDGVLYGSDVAVALAGYVDLNRDTTRLKPYKVNMSRYAKELQSKFFLGLEKSETDGRKREKEWDLKVPKTELTLVSTFSKLVSSMINRQVLEAKIRGCSEIVSHGSEVAGSQKLALNSDSSFISEIVSKILVESKYDTNSETITETNSETNTDTNSETNDEIPTPLKTGGSDTISEKWNKEVPK